MRSVRPYPVVLAAVALLAAALLAPAPASAFKLGFGGVRGSGDLESRTLDVERFDRIVLDGSFDIAVQVGPPQRVEVTLDDNLFDLLRTDVRAGALHIDWKKDCRPDRKARAAIAVPALAAVTINGAGDIEVEGLGGDAFAVEVNGAGDIELAGKVGEFRLEISGAGDVDAGDLVARDVTVRINGAGDADVHATESLVARVSGVGDVTYAGDPEDTDISTSGVGEVRAR